jgi:hypothetical protein
MSGKFDLKGIGRVYFYWDREKDQIFVEIEAMDDKVNVFSGTLKELMEFLTLWKLSRKNKAYGQNVMHIPFSLN